MSEKLGAKLPVTTCGYCMVTFACLNDAFSELIKLEASPVEGQLRSKNLRKGEKGKAQKKEKRQDVHVGHFILQKS